MSRVPGVVPDLDINESLFKAIRENKLDTVKFLLENGADIESKNNIGDTLLLSAASDGKLDLMKLLIENGADIEAKSTTSGWTSLALSVFDNKLDVIKLLIENRADIEAKDDKGRTPFALAATKGKLDVMKLLLENGADIESKTDKGETPLALSASIGKLDSMKLLIENGADIEAKSTNGWTPFILATLRGNLDVMKLLIENGADIEAKEIKGFTPIALATIRGKLNTIKFLIENGADIESKNENGETPLRLSAINGKLDILKLLIENGADTTGINFTDEMLEFIGNTRYPTEECKKSRDDLRVCEDENNAFAENVSEMLEKIETLTGSLDNKERENNVIIQEKNVLKQEKNDITQEKNVLKQENNVLIQEKNEITQEKNVLTQENNDLTQENNVLKQEKNDLTQEKNILTTSLTGIVEQLRVCNARPRNTNTDIPGMSSFISDQISKLRSNDVAIAEEVNVGDFLNDDKDNIVFVVDGKFATIIHKDNLNLEDPTSLFYECIEANSRFVQNNNITGPKLFALRKIGGVQGGLVWLEDVQKIKEDSSKNAFILEKVKRIETLVSMDVIDNLSIVSGTHCQPGLNDTVYKVSFGIHISDQ